MKLDRPCPLKNGGEDKRTVSPGNAEHVNGLDTPTVGTPGERALPQKAWFTLLS